MPAVEKVTLRVEVYGGAVPAMDAVPEGLRDTVYRVVPSARAHPATWAFCVRHTPLEEDANGYCKGAAFNVLREKAEALTVGWALGRLGCDAKVMVEWWVEGS